MANEGTYTPTNTTPGAPITINTGNQGGQAGVSNASYILQAQTTSDLVDDLRMFLKGEQWVEDSKGKFVKKQVGDAYMNDKGVAALCGIVNTKVNRILLNANYKKQDTINRLMVEFGDTLNDFITAHYWKWGLDLSSSSMVFWTIVDFVDAALSQTFDPTPDGIGAWRRFGMTTQQYTEIRDTSPAQNQPQSSLQRLPFMGRKTS